MVNTRNDVLLLDGRDGLAHECLMARLEQAHEQLGPQRSEVGLHLAEDELDWIRLWRIGQIVDVLEAVLSHGPAKLAHYEQEVRVMT